MEKNIPLHALVLVISNRSQEVFSDVKEIFQRHEITSIEEVKRDLVGNGDHPELDAITRNELHHRIALKLSLGERVVVLGSLTKRERRMALVDIANQQGAPVIYLIDDTNFAFEHNDTINDGDSVATVVHLRKDKLYPVLPLSDNPFSTLKNRFRGITVVGDVHANLDALNSAIEWATSRDQFMWFLGDLIDYGSKPVEVLETIHGLVTGGLAATLIGNHERKIARYLHQQDDGFSRPVRLSQGNIVTVDAVNALPNARKRQWCGKFKSILARSSLISHVGNLTMAHGAVHPDVWLTGEHRDIESYALYGQSDPTVKSPDFKLTHHWIDHVPADAIVMVGHEIRSRICPVSITGKLGGKVVFMDTGCGKGGPLSTADLRFDHNQLVLENFNRYE